MSITSVPHQGVKDWIKQRVTAFVLLAYLITLAIILMTHQPLDFQQWQAVFHPLWFKVFSVIAFLSTLMHAWVGIWTIFTDYVRPWSVRFVLMWLVAISLFAYFIWFIQILWGV